MHLSDRKDLMTFDMSLFIASTALRDSLAIYDLISSVRLWNQGP